MGVLSRNPFQSVGGEAGWEGETWCGFVVIRYRLHIYCWRLPLRASVVSNFTDSPFQIIINTRYFSFVLREQSNGDKTGASGEKSSLFSCDYHASVKKVCDDITDKGWNNTLVGRKWPPGALWCMTTQSLDCKSIDHFFYQWCISFSYPQHYGLFGAVETITSQVSSNLN